MALKVGSKMEELKTCARGIKNPDSFRLLNVHLDPCEKQPSQVGVYASQTYVPGIIDLLSQTISDLVVSCQWSSRALKNMHIPVFDLNCLRKTETNRRILRNKIFGMGVPTRHLLKHGGDSW